MNMTEFFNELMSTVMDMALSGAIAFSLRLCLLYFSKKKRFQVVEKTLNKRPIDKKDRLRYTIKTVVGFILFIVLDFLFFLISIKTQNLNFVDFTVTTICLVFAEPAFQWIRKNIGGPLVSDDN